MDTLGRTTLAFSASNVIDEARDQAVIVTYNYNVASALRKPLTVFAGILGVFGTAWLVGNIDVSIGRVK